MAGVRRVVARARERTLAAREHLSSRRPSIVPPRLRVAVEAARRRLADARTRIADPAARSRLGRFTRTGALTLVAIGVVSVALALGAFATATAYGQFGAPRMRASTVSWIERAATYGPANCRACHQTQASIEATAAHAGLICETCHLPTVAHPGTVPGVIQALPAPTSAVCSTCHAVAAGRPVAFPQVALGDHYPNAECLRCHDPHTSTAVSPPDVPHPLANLPDCVTCHAPGGLKRFPTGHQPAADSVCRSCHRAGVPGPIGWVGR